MLSLYAEIYLTRSSDPGAPSGSQQEPPTQQGASQIPSIQVKEEESDEWPDEDFFHDAMDVDTTLVNTQPPPIKSQQDAVMPDATPAPAVPAPAPPPAQEIQLSADQQRVLDMVKRGESVFFTGSAGMYLSHSHRRAVHRGYRNGEVRSPARDHQAAWWSPQHQACRDCLDRYRLS